LSITVFCKKKTLRRLSKILARNGEGLGRVSGHANVKNCDRLAEERKKLVGDENRGPQASRIVGEK